MKQQTFPKADPPPYCTHPAHSLRVEGESVICGLCKVVVG